jgi:iron complex transport system substrate-binding protein
VDYTPQRVVSLQPSATAILDAVGLRSRIVACTKYCVDVCPEIAGGNRIMVTDSWDAKSAELLASRPDLVIAAIPFQEKSVAEILKAGVRFLGLAPHCLADIYSDIAVIAGVMGVSARGDKLISGMTQAIEEIRMQSAGLKRPRVYCEEWGKPLIASQRWVAELIAAAGGEFIGVPGAHTSVEAVLREDPDVIIAAWCGAGDRVPLEKIIESRGWAGAAAARTGRVYCVRDEFLNTPAPTLVHGLRALAYAIHPQKFSRPEGIRGITNH